MRDGADLTVDRYEFAPSCSPSMVTGMIAQLVKVPWWKYIRQPASDRRHRELRHARRPLLSAKYVR